MLQKVALGSLALLAATSVVGQSTGKWDIVGNSAVVCIHSIQLPNGKLLCIERPREHPYAANPNSKGRTVAEITLLGESPEGGPVNARSSVLTGPLEVFENAFCGHHVQKADGTILVVGGDPRSLMETPDGNVIINDERNAALVNSSNIFLTDGARGVRTFTPCEDGDLQCESGTWTKHEPMTTQRWYPTVVTLADESHVIIGGSHYNINMDDPDPEANNNPTYEYYPPLPANGLAWPRNLPILDWAFPHSLYPIAYLMPSEKVWLFVSNRTNIIDPKEDATAASVVNGLPKPKSAGNVPEFTLVADQSPFIYPHTPASVVLPMTIKNNWAFKVLICGGSKSPASATAEGHNAGAVEDGAVPRTPASELCVTINPDDPSPQWGRVDDMPVPRLMPDNVLLPDGKILYVNGATWGQAGGNGGQVQYAYPPVYEVHIFDPEAPSGKQWTAMEPMTVPRLYHSGALLLPSGHVITTGSEMNNFEDYWPTPNMNCWPANATNPCRDPFETRIERFAPPYLLQKEIARPVIKSAPKKLTYGSSFKIDMETDGTLVDRVTFIRYGTSTHSLNTDQRFVELVILGKTKSALYVEAPSKAGVAPPGNWMLWTLTKGIPSTAKTVNLRAGEVTKVDVPSDAKPGNGDEVGTGAGNAAAGMSRGMWLAVAATVVAGVFGFAL